MWPCTWSRAQRLLPAAGHGLLIGTLQADQSISFQAMSKKLTAMMDIVRADPAVENVVGYTGVGSGGGNSQINTGSCVRLAQARCRNAPQSIG